MFVNDFSIIMIVNPFYNAYSSSDFLGKIIFLALITTSIWCWSVLIHKIVMTRRVKVNSLHFSLAFSKQKNTPLQIENESVFKKRGGNPFLELFLVLKKQTIDILNKNRRFGEQKEKGPYLSSSDIDCLSSHLSSAINMQIKCLEGNLFILSTIVGLAPLLGLLGTVWGILTTFSQLQSDASGISNQVVLGGIALALTTTVLGLVSAIPALIAYNYLKNSIHNFESAMESFSNEMLSSVEMQYRKVDLTPS